MRILVVMLTAIALTGCGGITTNVKHGYKSYDPCVRCGESWIIIPQRQRS